MRCRRGGRKRSPLKDRGSVPALVGLWIIDQHVAHERILFEKVLRDRAAGDVEMQRLLIPLVLQLTAAQQIEYARIADELQALGFETEPFGNRTIAVKASPAGI